MSKKFERLNPESESSGKAIRLGTGSKSSADDIIGFINRDEQITSKLSAPQIIYPLGRDFMKEVAAESGHAAGWQTGLGDLSKYICFTSDASEAVPGIATLFFTPVFADKDSDGDSMTHQSYLSKWMAARNLDNMTKNWQPGDMQFVDCGLALIRTYVSYIRRALLTIRDVAQKSSNNYYNPTALLLAMGFRYTEQEATLLYPGYFETFNKIISTIKANDWLDYSFPGAKRWAALCRSIYRDTPADTRYAQYYVFVPSYMAKISEVYDSGKRAGWQLDWAHYYVGDEDRGVDPLWARYRRLGNQGLNQALADLRDLVNKVFYDDSTKDIIATLAAMMKRNLSSDLTESSAIDEDRIDFASLDNEYRAPEKFDSAMLLAIHNATINNFITCDPAFINPATGRMTQTLRLASPSEALLNEGPADPDATGLLQAWCPKVINFPNIFPTTCDLINATQWTLSLANTVWAESEVGNVIPNAYVGSDFIEHVDIIVRSYSNDGSGIHPLDEPDAYSIYEFNGVLLDASENKWTPEAYYDQFNGSDLCTLQRNNWSVYELMQQFAFAPMAHRFNLIKRGSDWQWVYRGPVVQSEVYYICDGLRLNKYHGQWKANFWGFPIRDFREGSLDLTVNSHDSNSDGSGLTESAPL